MKNLFVKKNIQIQSFKVIIFSQWNFKRGKVFEKLLPSLLLVLLNYIWFFKFFFSGLSLFLIWNFFSLLLASFSKSSLCKKLVNRIV